MPEIVGSLRPPRLSTPPPSPARGEIYYDVDDDKLYYWNGSTWIQSGVASGTATVFDTDEIGTIKAFSGATIPANWMLADGSSLLRASYPQLFAAIGTTYGSVDATHFNLPDLRGKMIYGANNVSTQGATGGSSVHTLDLTQIPGHNHGGATGAADRSLATTSGAADRALYANLAGDHQHRPESFETLSERYGFYTGSGGTVAMGSGGAARYLTGSVSPNTNIAGAHTHTVTDHLHSVPGVDHLHGINTDGGGLSHNNMPPYITIAQLIKVTGATIDSGSAIVGATGAKGDPGPWRGAWAAATAYAVGESVSYFDGSVTGSYRRKIAGTTAGNPKADTTNWEVIASGGSIGMDGAVAVYEQPATPASTTVGAIWIDTDDVPPTWGPTVPFVTSLPGSPYDGQEIYFLVDSTNGIVWHLRYRASSPSTYKWEYVGGSHLYAEVITKQAVSAQSWSDPATPGPLLNLPLAGDYVVNWGGKVIAGPTIAYWWQLGLQIGGVDPPNDDYSQQIGGPSTGGAGTGTSLSREERLTGRAANDLLKMRYKVINNPMDVAYRFIDVRPVRVA